MNFAGVQVDLGLVMQHELVTFQCGPQLGHGLQPGRIVGSVSNAVDVMAPQGCLGPVHRDVGFAQQRAQVGTVVGEQRNADAYAAVQRDVLNEERLVQRRTQLDGDFGGPVVADVLEQDRELVAAQPCHQVLGAHVLA